MAVQNLNGYVYEFADNIDDYECPVCLSVTREPHQTDCCGQDFCQACIESVLLELKPCPFCNTAGFKAFLDKKQRRKIPNLKIHCGKRSDGCDWVGSMKDIDSHLSIDGGDCQYVTVNCTNNCGEHMQRKDLTDHLDNDCLKRPYSCEYCQLEDNFEEIQNIHSLVCKKCPIQCPNDCQIKYLERGQLDYHIGECPLEVIECELKQLGCDIKLLRKDLTDHLANDCLKRPYSCEYCQLENTFEEIQNSHLAVCAKYPIQCPNNCEIEQLERGQLEHHINECPLEVIECELKQLGCDIKLLRKDLTDHLANDCLKRPYSCEYCQLENTFEEIQNIHLAVCVKYPIQCPNNCPIKQLERGQLDHHINECRLEVIECELKQLGCDIKLLRKNLADHLANNCLKRPYSCEYCQLENTFEEIQNSHLAVCVKYPIQCPNNCPNKQLERGQLDHHINECPLQMYECEYKEMGCTEKMLRNDISTHNEQNTQRHLKLMFLRFTTQIEEKDRQIRHLEKLVKAGSIQFTLAGYKIHTTKMGSRWDKDLEFFTLPIRYTLKITFFFRYSRIEVELNSLNFDEQNCLQWPMRCTMTVTIFNHVGDFDHYQNTMDLVVEKGKTNDEMRIDCQTIEHPPPGAQYLIDDRLHFRVDVILREE